MDGPLKIDHDQIGTQLLRMLFLSSILSSQICSLSKKGTCLSDLKRASYGKLQKCLTPYYKDLDVNFF